VQPGRCVPCGTRGLGRRDRAAPDGHQNGGYDAQKILGRPHRRQVDPETLCRVDGGERRRQELRGEGPQQMRLAVEQVGQRLRAYRPSG
jgi:hypothetical protein